MLQYLLLRLKLISRYGVPEWLVVKIDCSWAFASLEDNCEPSIEEQAGELRLVCGSGQQLWLHQGPIRDCVCPARLTPAGVYVSAPLREEGTGRKSCGLVLVFLAGCMWESSCILTGQWKVTVEKRLLKEEIWSEDELLLLVMLTPIFKGFSLQGPPKSSHYLPPYVAF